MSIGPIRLTPEERARLSKLAGMLGSHFEGERLSALSMIQKMADSKKARIDELLLHGQTEIIREVVRFREAPPQWQQKPEPNADDWPWRDAVKEALAEHERERLLTDWEVGFATDMLAKSWSSPTDKQRSIIDRIKTKLKTRREMRQTA